MAVKTLEKNVLLKFFEIYKDKFFKLLMLNSIFTVTITLLTVIMMGLCNLSVNLLRADGLPVFFICGLVYIAVGPLIGTIMKMCRDYVREEPGFFFEDFKNAFKGNVGQCLVISTFQYICVWVLYIAVYFYFHNQDNGFFYTFGLGVTFVAVIIFIFMSYYLYIMAVTLKLKLREIFKNALIFSLYCILKNLLLTIIIAVWLAIFALYGFFMITSANGIVWGVGIVFVLTLVFGFIFYSTAFITYGSIKKLILDPYYEKHPEETSALLETKKASAEKNSLNGYDAEDSLPEYVYHNGKMVHRSALELDRVFTDTSTEDLIKEKKKRFENNIKNKEK